MRRLLGATFASGLALGAFLLAAPTAGAATQSFAFTGADTPFVVPAGVCQVTVDAFGADPGAAAEAAAPGSRPRARPA